MTRTSSIMSARIAKLAALGALGAMTALSAAATADAHHHGPQHGKSVHGKRQCEIRTGHRHLGRRCGSMAPQARVAVASSSTKITWSQPLNGAKVSGDLVNRGCRALVTGVAVKQVVFSVDGHKVNTEYFAPYNCFVATRRLSEGTHTMTAATTNYLGARVRRRVSFTVGHAPAPTPAADVTVPRAPTPAAATSIPGSVPTPAPAANPTPTPTSTTNATWADGFESGDFTRWSWWGQGDPTYAHLGIVSAAAEGIDAPGGTKVARFETTPEDAASGRYHAKLYKGFGSHVGYPDSHSPPNVSGTYSASYYLPTTYKVPHNTWVNIFQFKEKYQTPGGGQSDPLWWLQLGDAGWAQGMASGYGETMDRAARPDAPVVFVSRWGGDWKVKRNFVPLPLGRWFEIKAVVKQGQSIDFYIDGKLLNTVSASEYPIGPFHGSNSMEWTWGVGNYSTGANGPLYVDDVSFTQG